MPTVENYHLGGRKRRGSLTPSTACVGWSHTEGIRFGTWFCGNFSRPVGEYYAPTDSPGVLASEKASVPTGKPCRLYSVAASYISLMSCSSAIVIITLTRRRSMATITKTFGWM